MYAAWWGGFLDETGAPDSNGRYLGRQWYIYDDRSRVTALSSARRCVRP
jgi:hypothetical protein